MAVMSKIPFSGASASFAPIAVGTSAATIHTGTSTAGYIDDMWLHATNTTSAPIRLTLTKCGISVLIDVPPAGSLPLRIFDGVPIAGGGILTASAASSGVYLDGWVNRYKAS